VEAPCDDGDFYVEVSVNPESCNEVCVHTSPGFLMLELRGDMKGYKDVFAHGSRFCDFIMRFPDSFKRSFQRDRVIYYGA
jgi:hypothetical protein